MEEGVNGPPSLLWPKRSRRERHNGGTVEDGEDGSKVESGVLTPVKTLSGNLCFNVVRDSQGIPQSYIPKANCEVQPIFDGSKLGDGKQVHRADLLKLEDLAALTISAESEYATAALTLPTGKKKSEIEYQEYERLGTNFHSTSLQTRAIASHCYGHCCVCRRACAHTSSATRCQQC